jgi:hypothetical protein
VSSCSRVLFTWSGRLAAPSEGALTRCVSCRR